jgi:catechol 2,3-dioxygenase-like lactoylglutathione lyase family enzyme
MSATGFNHVNVSVEDVDSAVEFYETVLGLERIPSINSTVPGAWFRVGDAQLHLTERGGSAPTVHHFAVTVDDFEAVFDRAVERDALDEDTFGSALYEFPDGAVQLYLRDPSDNLLECDWPDATTLPDRIRERVTTREERYGVEQTGAAAEATLFPDW